jgi:hypothetical protein
MGNVNGNMAECQICQGVHGIWGCELGTAAHAELEDVCCLALWKPYFRQVTLDTLVKGMTAGLEGKCAQCPGVPSRHLVHPATAVVVLCPRSLWSGLPGVPRLQQCCHLHLEGKAEEFVPHTHFSYYQQSAPGQELKCNCCALCSAI